MTTNRKQNDLPAFFNHLHSSLTEQLEQIEREQETVLDKTKNCITICMSAMQQLKEQVCSVSFESKQEEIKFFKEIKPTFFSKIIYYLKLFYIETRRPVGDPKAEEQFLLKENRRLNHFFENNQEFYQYYRSGATYFDEQYFLRGSQDLHLTIDAHYFDSDPGFRTSQDYKLSKLIAYEQLRTYLHKALALYTTPFSPATGSTAKPLVTWTGSKTALIELLYALQSTGVFNNGAADVKQIATCLQETFHVELGNYYRTFQEIRIRKGSRTQFLEQLQERLVKRMDETDEFGNNGEVRNTSYEVRGKKMERAKW